MKNRLSKLVVRSASTLTALMGALALIVVAGAWTAPPSSPPANNAAQPITVGSATEIKTGSSGSGMLALPSIVADRICFGSTCYPSWAAASPATPNCQVCVRAGVMNSTYGAWSCKAFNGGYASSGVESSHNGRGTTFEIRMVCS